MRVNWFLPVDHTNYNKMSASVWIRCLQLLPALHKLGIDSTVNTPERPADIAIYIRQQHLGLVEHMQQQRQQNAKIVYDMVVNYFQPSGPVDGLGNPVSAEQVSTVKRIAAEADLITCASGYIAKQAAVEFPHKQIAHLPDPIDLDHFNHQKSVQAFKNRPLIAGWSGVSKKAGELEKVRPLLKKHRIRLLLVTDKRPTFINQGEWLRGRWAGRFGKMANTQVEIIAHRWRYETFAQQISQAHFGISPRFLDSPYNLGHSSFKIGVFLAQGLPVIASPVPSYLDLMQQNGETSAGIICNNWAEWDDALGKINNNRDCLIQYHQQAHATAEKISIPNVAAQLKHLFEATCAN